MYLFIIKAGHRICEFLENIGNVTNQDFSNYFSLSASL
jgi:hypothetical protein